MDGSYAYRVLKLGALLSGLKSDDTEYMESADLEVGSGDTPLESV
jgi:hypothetical protein